MNEKGGKKKKKESKNKGPHVDLPPAELVMKYPIEVWVSCGETFKKPESELGSCDYYSLMYGLVYNEVIGKR